jgi:hypothetical protein
LITGSEILCLFGIGIFSEFQEEDGKEILVTPGSFHFEIEKKKKNIWFHDST